MSAKNADVGTTSTSWAIGKTTVGTIDASTLTASRTIHLPDEAGTFELREDLGTNWNKLTPTSVPVFANSGQQILQGAW